MFVISLEVYMPMDLPQLLHNLAASVGLIYTQNRAMNCDEELFISKTGKYPIME